MEEAKTIQPLKDTELQQAEALTREFFDKLGIQAETSVEYREDTLDVLLQTEETGIIIGYHGETLDSLQLLLSLALSKRIGRFVRVLIDVGDYRKNRTEYLERLAQQIKDRALRENREQTVTSLKSWERRVIHLMLQDDKEVITESQGAGRDRVLVIRPR